ncbi:hypothetical protein PMAC_000001 [Pneumocystis sp. 'macacae']|nr:hypothetical protein PMAC_000001 [Pneumocystis sp. 'macacae']
MSGQELVRGKDKVVCTKQRVSVCTKSNEKGGVHVEIGWEEGVCTKGEEGVEVRVRGADKAGCAIRREGGGGVHEAPRAQVGEVRCEKILGGANESVHQAVSGRRGYVCTVDKVGCSVYRYKREDEQEMEVEMESRSNKIEEVEVEVEIDLD